MRRGGLAITAIYVLVGPLAILLLHLVPFHAIDAFVTSGDLRAFRTATILRAFNPLAVLVLLYFYVIGLFPAIATAELGKLRLRRVGSLRWWESALLGGLASIAVTAVCQYVGFPQLVFIEPRYKDAGAVDFPIMFVSGFLATAICWLLTRRLQRRYAAGRDR